ncbi:MAG: MarR family transcriptional regulator, partial [Pseudomonadota bacterium]
VSQTLIALEGKRLVRKTANERDARSVALALTAAGRRVLAGDRERALARDIDATGEAAPLARALEAALRRALERRGGRAFGVCKTCRHFRTVAGADAPHHCALLDAPLSAQDAQAICVEMEAA